MTTYTAHSIDGDVSLTLTELANPGTDWSDEGLIPVTDPDENVFAWIDPINGMAEGETPEADRLLGSAP